MQVPGLQVHLVPAQPYGLADPQAVPVHQEQQGPVTGPIATRSARRIEQMLHFGGGQVLAGACIPIGPAAGRGDFPVLGIWGGFSPLWQFNDLAHGGLHIFPKKVYYRESSRH